ncbi:YciI family protein [Prauserella rugosa]|uniref:Uncharacterized protein YciI n=1 Tax=Prauserella rugosa TaxID=43354 RepID=A0A660CGD5_9PSEU|nr:YciI family protein [Prauserella rugosa]KMS65910.1 hypothetical protein ACZ91_70150 [Streptomyces regensis]TWH20579.1 uncharacterized protein YciI [Prauserella rugosa]
MYVVMVTYTAPVPDVDYALPDHAEWLAKQYEQNHLIASGRRDLHRGEVLIVRPMSRLKLDAMLASDPLSLGHLAAYEVIEFSASRTCHELHAVNELLAR